MSEPADRKASPGKEAGMQPPEASAAEPENRPRSATPAAGSRSSRGSSNSSSNSRKKSSGQQKQSVCSAQMTFVPSFSLSIPGSASEAIRDTSAADGPLQGIAWMSKREPLQVKESRVEFLFKHLPVPEKNMSIPQMLFGPFVSRTRETEAAARDFTETYQARRQTALTSSSSALAPGLKRHPIHWDNFKELWAAYRQLQPLDAENEVQDKEIIRAHGIVCIALERYREAQQSMDKLKDEKDSLVRDLSTAFPRVRSIPLFMNNYVTRSCMAVDTLKAYSSKILKLCRQQNMDTNAVVRDFAAVSQAFLDNLNLNVFVFPENKTPLLPYSGKEAVSLVFSSPCLDLDLLPIQQSFALMGGAL